MAAFLGNLRNVVITSFVLAILLVGVYCATQGFDGIALIAARHQLTGYPISQPDIRGFNWPRFSVGARDPVAGGPETS